MKLTKIVKKNLKLLIRAKSSAFIVVLGPLLIIILVGLALNKPTTYDFSVGYYTADAQNELTTSFVEEIRNNNYVIINYDSNHSCIEAIKRGTIHTCILFPKNFQIKNQGSMTVNFYVDYSRTNIVYKIIDTLSSEFEIRTSELSQELTEVLLNRILETKKDIDSNILSVINMKTSVGDLKSDVDDVQDLSEGLDFSLDDLSVSKVDSKANAAEADKDEILHIIEDAIEDAKNNAGCNETQDAIADISDVLELNISNKFDDLESEIDNVSAKISDLEDKLEISEEENDQVISKLGEAKTSLDNFKSSLDSLKTDLESTSSNLEKVDVTSAETIVSPIKTQINPVASETNQLKFLYPYLLIMVVMFIGIMLSSALIIMEKNSKAAFRNFTTPTKTGYFVTTTFITGFLVLLLQTIVIVLLSAYFLNMGSIGNLATIGTIALILLITIAIFVLIGMIIGYLSATQEAATMLSIAAGSIFLLLSNLVLPLETMSEFITNLARFNPYVISSEMLRRSFLFNVEFSQAYQDILILAAFMGVLIVLTYLINKISTIKFVQKTRHIKKKPLIAGEKEYLKIDDKKVYTKKQLLEALESTEELTKDKRKEVRTWTKEVLQDKKLSSKFRFKSKDKIIKVLKNNVSKDKKNTSSEK